MPRPHLFDRHPHLRAIVEPALVILGIVYLCFLGHTFLEADADNLCSSEATAYPECSEREVRP